MSSSSELRALESKLNACAVARDNSAAVAEKEAQKKIMNVGPIFRINYKPNSNMMYVNIS